VQLYVRRKNKNAGEPTTTLKNFKRVYIKKGKAKDISLSLSQKDLEYWDDKQHAYIVYPGEYEILVGSSAEDIKLNTVITIK